MTTPGRYVHNRGTDNLRPLEGLTPVSKEERKMLVLGGDMTEGMTEDMTKSAQKAFEQMLDDTGAVGGINPKDLVGQLKPSFKAIPPVALIELSRAMSEGAGKYGRFNWRGKPVTATVYQDALLRHYLAWIDGEDIDPKTGVKHLAYIMANCCILLDAQAQGVLIDDRHEIETNGERAPFQPVTTAAWLLEQLHKEKTK